MAAQYDLDYRPSGEPDPVCLTDHGDITEVTAKVCRTTPSDIWSDQRDGIEAQCIFPFNLNGESYSTCILDELRKGAKKCTANKYLVMILDHFEPHPCFSMYIFFLTLPKFLHPTRVPVSDTEGEGFWNKLH